MIARILALIGIVIAATAGAVVFILSRPPESGRQPISTFEECVSAGNLVMESYPRQCRTQEGRTFVEPIGDTEGRVFLTEPQLYDTVSSPLQVTGKARGSWYFEGDFPVRLLDGEGNEIAVAPAQAQGEWMTEELVSFRATLRFELPDTSTGTLVLEKDNPSGLLEHAAELRLSVRFPEETTTVSVHFNRLLEGQSDCTSTVAVSRKIAKTEAVARAALEQLFLGPTEEETAQGLFTSINPGVKVQSLVIEDGVARADFSRELDYQVGGSCRVAAIWSQVSKTLLEFPTVQDVVISIDGRTEDILQP